MVAPLTKAPALLDKNKQAPATSSGVPILPSGVFPSMTSLYFARVSAITGLLGPLVPYRTILIENDQNEKKKKITWRMGDSQRTLTLKRPTC